MALRFLSSVCLMAGAARAQQIGSNTPEQHPQLALWTCNTTGCVQDMKSVVLDSNWRWVHDRQFTNCRPLAQDTEICPDPETCSENCFIEGVSVEEYETTYGVATDNRSINLSLANSGSRVYMLDDDSTYKMFFLKNREFTVTVDMNDTSCGLNGAVYFVEMGADGGKAHSGGLNKAGAEYGTGYCDAQCPHDMKFVNGLANLDGKWGSCCAEMDIWEANSRATAYTAHPCSMEGSYRCEGVGCDDVCDKDGCGFNSYRLGNKSFYGRREDFTVDSSKPLTVVTQFLTQDGTDTGVLSDIKRFYVQDGRVVPNSESSIADVVGDSLTDELCREMTQAFGGLNDFGLKGGLKAMGEALDRGMVLVMSLWEGSMLWLDSDYPLDASVDTPGVARGPCKTTTCTAAYRRKAYPTASVTYSDIKVGSIGSTFGREQSSSTSDDPWGQSRRLREKDVLV